jgi:hypothetical protein
MLLPSPPSPLESGTVVDEIDGAVVEVDVLEVVDDDVLEVDPLGAEVLESVGGVVDAAVAGGTVTAAAVVPRMGAGLLVPAAPIQRTTSPVL